MKIFLLLFAFFFSCNSFAVEFEYHGYLRAGVGTSGKGAKQECFSNSGASANEFRLGNECSIYSESVLGANILKGKDNEPFFRTQVRFAYSGPGRTAWDENDSDGSDISVVEAFVEAGRIDGLPLGYWVGKRFYRDVDLYMFDWYYYAEMNGNGAGVTNIPLGNGEGALAYLVQTGTTRTNLGENAMQVFDFRWQNFSLGSKDSLNLWLAYAEAPGGTSIASPFTRFQPQTGSIAGLRWRRNLRDGFNDFSLLHGRGLLQGINIWGDATQEAGSAKNARRWRLVNHLAVKPSAKIGLFLGAAAEHANPKTLGVDARSTWYSLGVRPLYFFSQHTQLAFEAGHSIVHVMNERDSSGRLAGRRHLTRLTIAPQLSMGPTLWDRPVLRAYYSRTFWNKANKEFVGRNAPSFAGATAGHAIGFQTEVWF